MHRIFYYPIETSHLFCTRFRLVRQIVISVVCLGDPAEENCHNTRESSRLRRHKGGVGREEEECSLQQRIVLHLRVLGEQRRQQANCGADGERSPEHGHEVAEGTEDGAPVHTSVGERSVFLDGPASEEFSS